MIPSADNSKSTRLLRYLDGSLPEPEVSDLSEALQVSLELRRELAELTLQQVLLAQICEEKAAGGGAAPPRQARTQRIVFLKSAQARTVFTGVAALAAVLVLLVALSEFVWPRTSVSLRLASVSGEVWIGRQSIKIRATADTKVRPGDTIETAPGAQAVLHYFTSDTELALRSESKLILPLQPGRPVQLEQGTLAAQVAHRPPGQPLVFVTPRSEATVIGTKFVLSADPTSTCLAVTEGCVHLKRLADGTGLDVAARQLAIEAEDRPLRLRPLPAPGQGSGLLGEYFPGKQLGPKPEWHRLDTQINFDWSKGRPGQGLNVDHFSVRWTGLIEPRFTERYWFEMAADDGVRLWVGNQLIIDEWVIKSRQKQMRAELNLEAGRKYPIQIEYFEASGQAFLRLYWHSDSQPRELIPQSQLYPPNGVSLAVTNQAK